MKIATPVLALLLICGATSTVFAQTNTPLWARLNPDSLNLKLLPVPTLNIAPEVGVQGGVSLDYFFNTNKNPVSDHTRNSMAWAHVQYSSRNQLVADVFWQIFTPEERWFTRGRVGYMDFYERFWGVGIQTLPGDAWLDMTYRRWFAQGRLLKRLEGKHFAGALFDLSLTPRLSLSDHFHGQWANIAGAQGSRTSGLGPIWIADYRNDPFSPTRGWYFESYALLRRAWLGSEQVYDEYLLDVRKYCQIGQKHILATQVFAQMTTGNAPLRELPRLGGPNVMRGYFMGRYRDRQYAALQAEYRWMFGRMRYGLAAFASAGQVGANANDFAMRNLRYAAGSGVRILISRPKNLYARIDVARSGEGDWATYIRVGEAF